MVQINKTFKHERPKYHYVTARGSSGYAYTDEELNMVLQSHKRIGDDVQVFESAIIHPFSQEGNNA
jgi:hypothetical protein